MNKIVIFGLCLFCALTNVKIGDVQIVELWNLACLVIGIFVVSGRESRMKTAQTVIDLIPKYGLFFSLMFLGSILSLRLQFYPPSELSIMKSPPWASFVRLAQVFLAASSFFIVALAIGHRRNVLHFAMRVYVWTGVISAIWAIISAMLWLLDVKLPGVYDVGFLRFRGFFFEGGPFGVYLCSVLVMLIICRFVFRIFGSISFTIQVVILTIALIGSQSKAAILLLIFLGAYWLYLQRRVGLLAIAPIVLTPIVITSSFYAGLIGYVDSVTGFNEALRTRREDNNLVMGRSMAAILLPRIVKEHPVAGVGIGNYSLVRNDPKILRGLPATTEWDLPGFGLFGYFAELGIPLTLYAFWLLSVPIRLAKGRGHFIGAMSAYPLLSFIFGVQLNFAYPWIFSGITLAAAFFVSRADGTPGKKTGKASSVVGDYGLDRRDSRVVTRR